ncbi:MULTISPECIES: hypothetical protein [unclassified Rhizobium]|uniref:hypothetical protein n=1 Tax=unclassified Rhizobium TaxID=2613769 RepID=UPI0012E3D267|nr:MULTISPECIES: hypothetical protein [unclassified Rhizobium]
MLEVIDTVHGLIAESARKEIKNLRAGYSWHAIQTIGLYRSHFLKPSSRHFHIENNTRTLQIRQRFISAMSTHKVNAVQAILSWKDQDLVNHVEVTGALEHSALVPKTAMARTAHIAAT